MSIDPKIGIILNIAMGVCTVLTGLAWGTVLDNHTAAIVLLGLSAAKDIMGVILQSFSSSEKGPLAK